MGDKHIDTLTYIVSIDTILDTPLACVAKLNGQVAALLMTQGWADRTQFYDPKWSVDEKAFLKTWADRDTHILQGATLTRIGEFINHCMRQDFEAAHNNDAQCRHTLLINIAPYTLEMDEAQDIIEAVEHYCVYAYEVKLVTINDKDLTPLYLKNHGIDMVCVPNITTWLEQHHEALTKCPIPTVHMVGPAYLQRPIDEAELADAPTAREMLSAGVSAFDALEFSLVEHIQLRFQAPRVFSSVISS